jgi:carbonic anhydrase|eukprot:Tamp_05750.p1 GENE.Tamp_05750~~Tamp_05750.p1  ORF type:complete len:464 (+),score=124.92 Tamp_05750:26-1417(+)
MAIGEPMAPAAHVVYAPADMESGGRARVATSSRRRAMVASAVGLACCVVGLAGVLLAGGEPGSNGRAESELTQTKLSLFGAPMIELAGKDSELFPSRTQAKRAAKHIAAAAAVLGEEVGVNGRTVELDAVKPLLDAHGTLNLAAVDQQLAGKSLVKGKTITLHDVPTQVTLTLPEDVTIAAPMVAAASKSTQLVTAQSHARSGLGWAYSGAARPDHWGALRKEWKVCESGLAQSPIDIVPTKTKGGEDLPPVAWDCGGSPCAPEDPTKAPEPSASVKMMYNGRYTELTDFSADKGPKLKSTDEPVQAIRFHTPSEHAIDGQYYDLEVQVLHGTGPEDIKTIVSLFFQSGGGEKTPAWLENIADVISPCHLSVDRTECLISDVPHHLTSEFSFAAVALDAQDELLHHYEYTGSLTTPPCTEGVKWLVARKPRRMNQVDWTAIAALQGKNNRPRQPRNGRVVNWV